VCGKYEARLHGVGWSKWKADGYSCCWTVAMEAEWDSQKRSWAVGVAAAAAVAAAVKYQCMAGNADRAEAGWPLEERQ